MFSTPWKYKNLKCYVRFVTLKPHLVLKKINSDSSILYYCTLQMAGVLRKWGWLNMAGMGMEYYENKLEKARFMFLDWLGFTEHSVKLFFHCEILFGFSPLPHSNKPNNSNLGRLLTFNPLKNLLVNDSGVLFCPKRSLLLTFLPPYWISAVTSWRIKIE